MLGFGRVEASAPSRQESAQGSGSIHIAAWIVFALMLTGAALIVAPSHAVAACSGPCSEEQIATGLANPPKWAEGRKIHFAPESIEASAYSPELEAASLLEVENAPLLFHEGGQVQHTPKIYVIYWGSNFTTTPKGIEDRAMLQKFFTGLTGSSYQGILTQYFDATGRISSTVSPVSYIDEKVKAPEKVTPVMIEEEVASAVAANKWTPETSAQFVVTTAPGSTYEPVFGGGCAYHGVTGKVPGGAVYDFDPYQGDPPFSTGGCISNGNPTKNPIFATSSVTSHEYAEAATDPYVNAWLNSLGQEIADICSSNPGVELPSGAFVQELYDDHLNACAKADLSPPHAYAITGSATAVNTTEATLNGTVNPESLSSQYYFEYGTTMAYGTKTAEVSAGSGIANIAASKAISSLTPGTTYHFRVAEVNSTGTTTGQDHTFTTTVPAWTLQSTPNPEGSTATRLRSISCTSSSACIAVGDISGGNLSEKWNGTEWSALSMPSAGTSINEVDSVSCTSSTACTAVGLYWSAGKAHAGRDLEWDRMENPDGTRAAWGKTERIPRGVLQLGLGLHGGWLLRKQRRQKLHLEGALERDRMESPRILYRRLPEQRLLRLGNRLHGGRQCPSPTPWRRVGTGPNGKLSLLPPAPSRSKASLAPRPAPASPLAPSDL